MQIKLENLDPVQGSLTVKGPQVEFALTDAGSANVTISLSLSDGTHFFYPDGSGKTLSKATTLPPGRYDCGLVINAFDLGVFGRSYHSTITIGGTTLATTQGSLADGSSHDSDFQLFALVVQ